MVCPDYMSEFLSCCKTQRREKYRTQKKIQLNFPKILVNLGKLASAPGSGSGLEDSDPLVDRILRPKDPDPDSVGFGFVPSTNVICT
jgi:hypothetical protein